MKLSFLINYLKDLKKKDGKLVVHPNKQRSDALERCIILNQGYRHACEDFDVFKEKNNEV